jgi:uncharacterized protein (DUF433 family)
MEKLQESVAIDWSDCPLVEVNPEKVSGVPILKRTRVQADSIVENFEDGSTVEEIADDFDIPGNVVRELLAYAKQQDPTIKV